MLMGVVILLAIISVLMAVKSLKDIRKGIKTHETRQMLKKGRVIFHSSDVSSSSKS